MTELFAGLPATRVVTAVAVALAYVLLSAYFLLRHRRVRTASLAPPRSTLIAFASQTGFAQQLALQTARSLEASGRDVRVASLSDVDTNALRTAERALFIVSTTGEGDAPDPAAIFVRNVLPRLEPLDELRYGLLALGDRAYANFCAFGHQLDTWLKHRGARSLFDVVEVDNGDEGALRHWQHHLSLMFDASDLPDWETPAYERWRLAHRELLNPGSAGDPCYWLVLHPNEARSTNWVAGDIVEIDPWNSHLQENERLPLREYSIASIPEDGGIELVVRRLRRPNGELGLGSGWLTQGAEIGGEIFLRVRSNPNFQLPASDSPIICIGNGTGIAGLRALLKARVANGQTRNWLIFGERNRTHDAFFSGEIDDWHSRGALARLDWVFSRDQAERRYVQHQLAQSGAELRQWIESGAYLFVCGSLAGMAPAVHTGLIEILGEAALDTLILAGRYRRDVY